MAKITIVGAGITGMAIADLLSSKHEITIAARNLPGDEPSLEWASPWAGAIFLFGRCSTDRERKMQLDSFTALQRLGRQSPDSSVSWLTVENFFDDITEDDVWWKDYVSEFKFLPKDRLPPRAQLGVSYTSLVLNPTKLLPWLRQKLESQGVVFQRLELNALSDVQHLGHNILINATGVGARYLSDVNDEDVQGIRGQTILVKNDYKKGFMHDSEVEYTYALPRGDGTVILGGVREPDNSSTEIDENTNHDIVQRLHNNVPAIFSADLEDYEILSYNVGIRPGRKSGIRLEAEFIDGRQIIHGYGVAGHGYIYSYGIAKVVDGMVDGFMRTASEV